MKTVKTANRNRWNKSIDAEPGGWFFFSVSGNRTDLGRVGPATIDVELFGDWQTVDWIPPAVVDVGFSFSSLLICIRVRNGVVGSGASERTRELGGLERQVFLSAASESFFLFTL